MGHFNYTLEGDISKKEMKGEDKRNALLQVEIPRLSSLTSSTNSSEMSDDSLDAEGVEIKDVPPTIHTLTECLHRIHALEKDNNNLQNSLLEALGLVQLLKQNQLEEMPFNVRKSALDSVQKEEIEEKTELVFLFGRCFNMSMNIKILNQCNYADPNIASRLLIDFQILASSLQSKLINYQCHSCNFMSLKK